MPGTKIEYLSFTPIKTAAATEYLPPGNQLIKIEIGDGYLFSSFFSLAFLCFPHSPIRQCFYRWFHNLS